MDDFRTYLDDFYIMNINTLIIYKKASDMSYSFNSEQLDYFDIDYNEKLSKAVYSFKVLK